MPSRTIHVIAVALLGLLPAAIGCGTSKWTDTGRSATEQLLITDAMDRAVSTLDFRALAGKTAYIDATPVKKTTDWEYLVSCMRQHMLACGCMVMENKDDADYVLEVRAGAIGTDRHDLLYGVPAVNVPSVVPVSGLPSQIPEMPIVKKTEQRGVVKLSVFAYNRRTGRPVWQSGAVPQESDAKAVWILGAGPFKRGSIYDGMNFAGDRINIPLIDLHKTGPETVSVADEAYFREPELSIADVAAETKAEEAPQANADSPAKRGAPGKAAPSEVLPAGHSAGNSAEVSTVPKESVRAAPAPRMEEPPAPSPAAAPAAGAGSSSGAALEFGAFGEFGGLGLPGSSGSVLQGPYSEDVPPATLPPTVLNPFYSPATRIVPERDPGGY